MSSTTLITLPSELLHEILYHSDYQTLTKLSETCKYLHNKTTDDSLWRHLARRRFRVTHMAPLSRRLRAAGDTTWRTLYANWHLQRRMPVSKHSGPNFRAFAKGGCEGALVWVTVPSSDDCRLCNGVLRVTVILQNLLLGRLEVFDDGIEAVLVDGVVCGRVCGWEIAGRGEWLGVDEFLVARVEVEVPGALFEVDALEQLVEIRVRVGGLRHGFVVAKFVEKEIWEAYNLLPGGWWIRVN